MITDLPFTILTTSTIYKDYGRTSHLKGTICYAIPNSLANSQDTKLIESEKGKRRVEVTLLDNKFYLKGFSGMRREVINNVTNYFKSNSLDINDLSNWLDTEGLTKKLDVEINPLFLKLSKSFREIHKKIV